MQSLITDRLGLSNSSVLPPADVSVTMTVKRKNSLSVPSATVHQDHSEQEAETKKFAFVNSNDATTVLTPQPHKKPASKSETSLMSSGEVRGTRVRGGRPQAKITSQKVHAIVSDHLSFSNSVSLSLSPGSGKASNQTRLNNKNKASLSGPRRRPLSCQ
jgi:hypothetical protein